MALYIIDCELRVKSGLFVDDLVVMSLGIGVGFVALESWKGGNRSSGRDRNRRGEIRL
ncbi:hypothetical protein ASPWEDRAFT_44648, partial [Aspergillus wentii DTO 134E9]